MTKLCTSLITVRLTQSGLAPGEAARSSCKGAAEANERWREERREGINECLTSSAHTNIQHL